MDEIGGEFRDFLPHADLLPPLSAEEVARFVALGERAREAIRAGDPDTAAAAFRGQIATFAANPAPWVELALLAARRGEDDRALELLHEAVTRGFTDLPRLERSEVWGGLAGHKEFRKLQNALPALVRIEREWPPWDSFGVWRTPDDVAGIVGGQQRVVDRVQAMAPALGPRLERLWMRLIDRATAAMLVSYIRRNPGADDLGDGLNRLMALCAAGPMRSWGRIPPGAAGTLGKAARMVLERDAGAEARATALVGVALAADAGRDRRGRLPDGAAGEIRAALQEVVREHPDSAVIGAAIVGLVRLEVAEGRTDVAGSVYRGFREARADDAELLARVQTELGPVGLELAGLPEFTATTLTGRTVAPEALRGRVVVLDFWATWCTPCLDELPSLRRIDERHGEDVLVLGVNLDDAESLPPDSLLEWIRREGVPGDHVQDGRAWDSELVRAFGVEEIPFNVVVGADGEVLAVNQHGKRLEKAVRAATAR